MIIPTVAEKGFIPEYSYDNDAGADLRAYIENEITLQPGESVSISSGIKIELPVNISGFVRSRSGLTRGHRVVVLGDGTIDPGYRGEIGVDLINLGKKPYTIKRGDRIAQLVLVPIIHGNFMRVKKLNDSERGENGFGSSGMR